MDLIFNNAALRQNLIGCPASHADAFKTTAASHRCVIIVRATGPTCTQLLEQGYDTKGFRIHGKSCDWGPMAGFVLRDPRLNKHGMRKAAYNRAQHQEAFTDNNSGAGWTASTTPLRLHQERVDWLIQNGKINVTRKTQDRYEGIASHPSGITFHYSLIRVNTCLGDMWGVYVDKEKSRQSGFIQERGNIVVQYDTKYKDMYEPLLAMTNPVEHRHFRNEHPLNAITGDYDLFAIWPFKQGAKRFDRYGDDRRILGTAQAWSQRQHIENQLERNFTTQGQGTKLGNITNRIYEVSQTLNSTIGGIRNPRAGAGHWGPFPRRNVLWHSDEAARPYVNDIDLPLIAFTPARSEVVIQTLQAFREFIAMCRIHGVHVTLAEGWAMNPTNNKPDRLGQGYGRFVPRDWHFGQWIVPPWYNA
ncbi:anthrax toxin-like adenylyl cyclase domain-containing protein [Microbulbifer sp. TRSA002]|uniref:anthrax toxin-like adenylyl cyclase domain-containing protein n=1 Tax=Microbulbifer sp. TRSA002 TaxID=3243382 RepID=UPI00403A774B